jgi:hypothetical protein
MINPILSKGDSVDHCKDGDDGFLQYVTLRDLMMAVYAHGELSSGTTMRIKDIAHDGYAFADEALSERAKPK